MDASLPRRRTSTSISRWPRIRSRSGWPASTATPGGFRLQDAMLPFTSTERRGPARDAPFASLPGSAATHFKLCFLAAVLHVLDQLSRNLGSLDDVLEQFPFMRDYLDEIERLDGTDAPSAAATEEWIGAVRRWERTAGVHLPLRALSA